MWGKFKWHMFITSLFPLWIAIILIDIFDTISICRAIWDTGERFAYNFVSGLQNSLLQVITIAVIIIVVVCSTLGINAFITKKTKEVHDKLSVSAIQKEGKLSTEFLLSCILPLVAFDFSRLRDVIIFLLFILTFAFLSIRNDNIYVNIYLEMRKYKIYSCTVVKTLIDKQNQINNCIVLSKIDLKSGEDTYQYWSFDKEHYIITEEE